MGVRGTVTTTRASDGMPKGRRSRSTRRRQDVAPLPRRKVTPRTVGRVFTAKDGKSYRPSMFLTLTCDSYGPVRDDGTPVDSATYDYVRAAQDALHFAAWWTGSSRICAACWVMRHSTSAPSNRSDGWPRTCTWPSAAQCPAR